MSHRLIARCLMAGLVVGGLALTSGCGGKPAKAPADIRRPDLLNVARTGIVGWYDDEKGYGHITADDGEILWVHFSGIEGDGFRSLKAGQHVSFVWRGGVTDHGRHAAEEVRPTTS